MPGLAIVGQVCIRAEETGRVNAPISASRISDVTAIPGRTVRREMQSLARRGWVEQVEGGGWKIIMIDGEAAAREGLRDLDQRSTERRIEFVRAMRGII